MLKQTNIDLSKAKKSSPIIARGESGNHCHVICGDADVVELNNEKYIIVRDAKLRHLLESEFNAGKEVWTKEHHDIKLEPGTYKYVPQVEYDPYNEVIQQVRD